MVGQRGMGDPEGRTARRRIHFATFKQTIQKGKYCAVHKHILYDLEHHTLDNCGNMQTIQICTKVTCMECAGWWSMWGNSKTWVQESINLNLNAMHHWSNRIMVLDTIWSMNKPLLSWTVDTCRTLYQSININIIKVVFKASPGPHSVWSV